MVALAAVRGDRTLSEQAQQFEMLPNQVANWKSSAVKTALESDGAEPGGNSSIEFARFMADELKSWGEVVRTSDAKVD